MDEIKIHSEEPAKYEASDGSTANYYDLTAWITDEHGAVVPVLVRCQDIVSALNMNGQRAESFRAHWRWGRSPHSSVGRDIRKSIFNLEEELKRIHLYEENLNAD